jgi:hypothetical protein
MERPGPGNGRPPFNDDPVDLQFGSDAEVRITVKGPGVPGGRQTTEGGGDDGILLKGIRPGTRLTVTLSGEWPACSYWSEDQPVAGDPNASVLVKVSEKKSFTLVVPSLEPGAARARDVFLYPEALVYRPEARIPVGGSSATVPTTSQGAGTATDCG